MKSVKKEWTTDLTTNRVRMKKRCCADSKKIGSKNDDDDEYVRMGIRIRSVGCPLARYS